MKNKTTFLERIIIFLVNHTNDNKFIRGFAIILMRIDSREKWKEIFHELIVEDKVEK